MREDLILLHAPSVYDFRKEFLFYGPVSDLVPSTPVFEMYPIGFTTMATALHEARQQAEQAGTALRESEARYRTLFDTMTEAMANAGKRASDVDYISAHGPGHPVLDRVETAMIKKVFGKRAYAVPVSSIKGVIGNPLSAAGALQVIACCLAMKRAVREGRVVEVQEEWERKD